MNEIKLKTLGMEERIIVISEAASDLTVKKLEVDISSQSVAMDAFVDRYNTYQNIIEQYMSLLTEDLQKITEVVSEFKNLDNKGSSVIDLLGK